jgi:hypothetical protein
VNRRLSTRTIFGLVVAVIALNLALLIGDALIDTEQVRGPAGSSYVTTNSGTAAWYELLNRTGHEVSRLRAPMDATILDPGATMVILEPSSGALDEAQLLVVRQFISSGGRLVAGGAFPEWLNDLLDADAGWRVAGAAQANATGPALEVTHVETIVAEGIGAWSELPPGATPVVVDEDDTPVAAVLSAGRGTIVLLADPSALFNGVLDRADNAAFALGISGEDGRAVIFNEYVHGYQDGAGVAAIPAGWRWGFGLGFVALVIYLVAIGRRLGPPEEPEREFPPSRREYLDAVAGTLARSRQPAAATGPVRNAARRLIGRRAGLPADAETDRLREAARGLDLTEDEIAAVFTTPRDEEELLAAGRALAKLSKR